MTFRAYLKILQKRWVIVVTMTALSALAAAGVTLAMPVTYAAQASAFVTITSTGTEANSLYQNSQFAMQRVKSYTDFVRSRNVLQPVIDKLKLNVTPTELTKVVTADNPVDTVLINITARASSPESAQDLANAISDQMGTYIERLETTRNGGTAPVKVTTAVPADLPPSPISPRPVLNLALGLLLGLALGIAAAVLREQQDTTIKDEDLEELFGAAPLGVIGFDPGAKEQPLIAMRKNAIGIEAFRSLRTNLQFVEVDRPPHVVVLTSSIANEGKTTIACNLAITLARSAQRVCLIEADLRRPNVSNYLGIDGTLGLTNVVAGQFELDDVLVPWNRGLLTVLPAGTTPPDPSELLGSRNMTSLVEQLRERFDIVLIDAPPLLPVTDAAVLSKVADAVLMVIRYKFTRREQVARAMQDLETVRARVLGTILTFVPSKGGRYDRLDYGYESVEDIRTASPSHVQTDHVTAASARPLGNVSS